MLQISLPFCVKFHLQTITNLSPNHTIKSEMPQKRFTFKTTLLLGLHAQENGKRSYFYDDKTEGLEFTVTKNGIRTFHAYKWINGRPRRLTLGRFNPDAILPQEFEKDPLIVLGNNPELTLEQARRVCRAVIGQWSSGQDPTDRRNSTREQVTLGELFKSYVEHYAKHHCKTWKVMLYCFDKYLSHWKRRPVKDISRADVQAFVNDLGETSGHSTANRTLELFRAIINKGREWKLTDIENPATGVRKFKIKPRRRFVREDELPRLVAAIQEEYNEDIRDYVWLSISTGARKSNILSMRWEYLDLVNGVWTIPDTKNGEAQEILLTPDELQILKNRFDTRTDFQWVFPGNGRSGHLEDPKKGWIRILNRAGIGNLHLHDLRRTLGSYMAMSGASLSVIGNALNHKDASTTRKVYAQTAREAERQARMNAHAMMFRANRKSKIVNLLPTTDEPAEAPTTQKVEF